MSTLTPADIDQAFEDASSLIMTKGAFSKRMAELLNRVIAASGAPSEDEARRAGMTPGTYRMWRDAGGPAPHEANPIMEAKEKWAKIKANGPANVAALEGIDLLFSLLEG